MPALPSDIAAALRPRIIVSAEDAALKARFPSARDGSTEPAEGFCDVLEHAQLAVAQRASLIGTVRRRAAATIDGMLLIAGGAVPTHQVIDGELGIDAAMMVSRIEVDGEEEQSKVEYFG